MASDLETAYADLFDTLPPEVRRDLVISMGSALHEGWEPSRADVELQVLLARNDIDMDEFRRRAMALARRRTSPTRNAS